MAHPLLKVRQWWGEEEDGQWGGRGVWPLLSAASLPKFFWVEGSGFKSEHTSSSCMETGVGILLHVNDRSPIKETNVRAEKQFWILISCNQSNTWLFTKSKEKTLYIFIITRIFIHCFFYLNSNNLHCSQTFVKTFFFEKFLSAMRCQSEYMKIIGFKVGLLSDFQTTPFPNQHSLLMNCEKYLFCTKVEI